MGWAGGGGVEGGLSSAAPSGARIKSCGRSCARCRKKGRRCRLQAAPGSAHRCGAAWGESRLRPPARVSPGRARADPAPWSACVLACAPGRPTLPRAWSLVGWGGGGVKGCGGGLGGMMSAGHGSGGPLHMLCAVWARIACPVRAAEAQKYPWAPILWGCAPGPEGRSGPLDRPKGPPAGPAALARACHAAFHPRPCALSSGGSRQCK